ncbi:MAG: chitobiase/beta-hexosaminidase C-terminal domain-containing protein [Bacteroides sp.]|nr:chitobiase/beta-hexosaminidase C-terminal domain-containing protein [Bacteroides sp.]
MKKLFLLGLTTLMTLFSATGLARADESETDPAVRQVTVQLMDTQNEEDPMLTVGKKATVARYFALMFSAKVGEESVTGGDVYYTFDGTAALTPEAYASQTEGKVMKASVGIDGTFLFTSTDQDEATLRLKVYVSSTAEAGLAPLDGDAEYKAVSEEFSYPLAFLAATAPTLDVASGTEVEIGSFVKVSNYGDMGEVYYSLKGEVPIASTELAQNYVPQGIIMRGEAGQTVTLNVINYREDEETHAMAGSKMTTATYIIKAEANEETALTFDPANGATVDAGTKVTITASKEVSEIGYKMYATLEEAQAESESQLVMGQSYSEDNKPEITAARPVLKAAAFSGKWEAVTYAVYTVNGGGTEDPGEEIDAELVFDTVAGKNYPIMMSIKSPDLEIMDAEYDVYYTTDSKTVPGKEAFERNPDSTIRKTGYHWIPTDDGSGRRVYAYAVMESNDTLKAQAYVTIKGKEVALPPVKRAVRVNSIPAPRASVASGLVEAGTKVVLKSDSAAATIYYTVNGTEPLYGRVLEDETILGDEILEWIDTRPYGAGDTIVITKDTVIKAIAYIERDNAGVLAGNGTPKEGEPAGSSVVEFRYTVKPVQEAAALVLSPDGSAPVQEGQTITVTRSATAPQNGAIAYKFYATEEAAKADEGFNSWYEGAGFYDEKEKPVLTQANPVISIGITDAGDADYAYWLVDPIVVRYTVTEGDAEEGVVLTFSPESNFPDGDIIVEGDTVTITASGDAEGAIYYIWDGSAMVGSSLLAAFMETGSDAAGRVKEYSASAKPIVPYVLPNSGGEDGLPVLSAVFRGADGAWSRVYSASYEVTSAFGMSLPKPEFTPAPGEYADSVYVTISCAVDTLDIVYMMNYDPQLAPDKTYYPRDSAGFKGLLVKRNTTIYARTIAQRTPESTWEYSDLVTAAYTIKTGGGVEAPDTLPAPVFSVAAGEVAKGTRVALGCDTADAKIYYSVNADTVTANSAEYTGEITIDSAMTIRAIAVKEGFVTSKVAVAAYTLEEVANDVPELAGVRLYPNPTEGEFSVEAPVEARVEIFSANGVIVKSFTMAAGVEEVRLSNSGIYFVRLTAGNGQVAVKRVIVR